MRNEVKEKNAYTTAKRFSSSQRRRPEAIGMEALYPELAQTPHQHWKVGSDQQ